MPLRRQARIASALVPARWRFRFAVIVSRLQGSMIQALGGNGPLTTAVMLDHWLRELSFHGSFPLPWKSEGIEVCLTPGPKMYCWTHLPLNEIPLRVYLESGGSPLSIVSDPGKIVGNNEFIVFGWPQRMHAIPVGSQLLARVKASLRSGTSVVFLADEYMGATLSEMPVRLAGRLGVPLVFQWAELLPEGTIRVIYRNAPFPYSRNEEEIAANLKFLLDARLRIMTALGLKDVECGKTRNVA